MKLIKLRTGLVAGKWDGNMLERVFKASGVAQSADKYSAQTGKDCGCAKRKAILDKLFPF
jgi:hypothetical protein